MSITSVAITLIFILFVGGALISPIIGVLGYLLIYFTLNPYNWYSQLFYQITSRPSFFAIFFLILGCIIHYRKLSWNFTTKEICFYLFALVAWWVTYFHGIDIDDNTLKFLYKITKVFVFIFIFLRVVNTWDRFNYVIWSMIVSAVFLGYQGHVSGSTATGRLEGVGGSDFIEANVLAAFLALNILILGYKLFNSNLWKSSLYAIGSAIMANTIVLTKSRSVFLGILFAGIYALFNIPPKQTKKFLVFSVLGLSLAVLLVDASFLERMGTITDENIDIGTDQLFQPEVITRIDFWKSSIEIFKDHPWGIGVANFADLVPQYDPRNIGMDPHNTYVKCYSEIGIIGILLFCYIIIQTFFELRKVRKVAHNYANSDQIILMTISLSAGIVSYLLGVMVTHSILYSEMIWILFALATCLKNIVVNNTAV